VLLTSCAYAQLGHDESDCRQQWGPPLSTDDSVANTRCLSYGGPASLSVKLSFIDGLAYRASYEKQNLAMADVEYLLRLNGQGCRWDAWTATGSAGQPASGRQWMRSDERAMASLSSNQLTIVAAEWNLPRPVVNSAATTNQITETTTAPTNATLAGTGMYAIVEKSKTEMQATPAPIRKTLPARLPSRGDSRRDAINILGPPTGTIMGGSKEILVYPWGNVWLTDGSVTFIE